MTLREWLADRQPAPPQELASRMRSLLAGSDFEDHEIAPGLLRIAADRLNVLTSAPSSGREAAFDLLAVDAMVTYAYEAAAELGSLPSLADDGMRRLSAAGDLPNRPD